MKPAKKYGANFLLAAWLAMSFLSPATSNWSVATRR
jgi:hypothetical protein